MPNLKSIPALAVFCGMTALGQTVTDAPGVSVDLGGAAVMHRSPVTYPLGARRAHVEGTVVLEVAVDSAGSVADARVLSGPAELRKSSILAVLQWHFAKDAPSVTRQVRITYQAPAEAASLELRAGMAVQRGTGPMNGKKIEHIAVIGLPDQARNELLSRLAVHEGDLYLPDVMSQVFETVRQFDEHLTTGLRSAANGGLTLQISVPGAFIEPDGASKRITIGGNVQQAKLVSQVHPVYPPEAKMARVQGTVSLQAVIAADGHVSNLTVLSGHPMLVQSAMDAVSQWIYQQTLLNGVPVEVVTQIDVNYTLAQ